MSKRRWLTVSRCPGVPLALGVIDGRHMVLRLDFCTLCGLGDEAAQDARTLTPRT